jgi:DNA-binding MarR family transcriptional regulator
MDPTSFVLPCFCANLRRAARAVSQLYEEHFRQVGLTGSQFSILQLLDQAGERTQGELGRFLSMDSTTLTRTLAIMERHGWIRKRPGGDRREWRINLSKSGEKKVAEAAPHWEKAQSEIRGRLPERWRTLMQLTTELNHAVSKPQSPIGE